MTTLTDLQNKINALYGYTPSQSYLLQNPHLVEISLYAIAANVSSLSAITTAYNSLMGPSFANSDLIAQPEKTVNGILAIASNTTSLSALATAYNTLMGTAFDSFTIKSRPDLIRLRLVAGWAGVTSLSAIISKINSLMGWSPTTAQLLADYGLMIFGINAIRANASNLSAIATAYNTLMGTAFDSSTIKERPDLLAFAVFSLDSVPIGMPTLLISAVQSVDVLEFVSFPFTPSPNSLLIAFLGLQASIENIEITALTATGGGLNWSEAAIGIAPSQNGSWAVMSGIFTAISPANPSLMQLTANAVGSASRANQISDYSIIVVEIPIGYAVSPIGVSNSFVSSNAEAGIISIPLPVTSQSTSLVFGYLNMEWASSPVTEGAGWIELSDSNSNNDGHHQLQYKGGALNSVDWVNCPISGSSGVVAIGLEIKG